MTHTADITEAGTDSFDVGGGSAEYEHQESTTGTIAAPSFLLNIDEEYDDKSIYVDNFVENVHRRTNSTLTSGSDTYQFVNVYIRKAFFKGRPSELDSYWLAQGALSKNGAQIGQVGGGVEGAQVKIWLDLPGERIELEAHAL